MASMSIPHSGRQLGRVSPIPPRSSFRFTGLAADFRIGYNRGGPHLRPSTSNHPSAMANAQVVADYIKVEVEVGRLVGPLGERVLPLVKTSPIGLVPKSHQVDKWRMIVDLSFPRGLSVNSGIISRVVINQVDDAVNLVGPGDRVSEARPEKCLLPCSNSSRRPRSHGSVVPTLTVHYHLASVLLPKSFLLWWIRSPGPCNARVFATNCITSFC